MSTYLCSPRYNQQGTVALVQWCGKCGAHWQPAYERHECPPLVPTPHLTEERVREIVREMLKEKG